MKHMKFVSYQKCHQVIYILVDCIIDKKFKFSMISFTALRGVVQEVSLITKKGVETKSYEGVSSN